MVMTVKMILPGTRLNDCPTAWQNFVKSFCDSHPNEDDYVTFASEEDYLAFMLTWG